MSQLDLSNPILLTDGEYTFVEMHAALVKLRSTGTGDYVILHVAELAQRAVGLLPRTIADARLLGTLTDQQQTRVLSLADHLREITTGLHPNRKEPRQDYDVASTTQEERVQAKLVELESTDMRMSRSTLMAKLAAFKKSGESAIIDGRAIRARTQADEDKRKVLEALVCVIASQRGRSTGTIGRIIELTGEHLLSEYGADGPKMPGERTMRRYYEKYSDGRHTTGSAKTRRSLADRPDRPFKKNSETFAGGEVQLDSTPLDVFVKVPGGKPDRPILTIMIDVASRSILSYTFRYKATKAVDQIALIAQALVPFQNQPSRTQFRDMVQIQNPGVTLLTEERLSALAYRRPFIYPRTIVIDNGKDYKATSTMQAAEAFGMSVVFSPPRTPTTKPVVERTFGSINTLFAQFQPGYTGRGVEWRGEKPEDEDGLLDIFALQELFHDWVVNVWQNRPHEGLRDPLFPSVPFSPNQMAAANADVFGTIDIPLVREDFIALLPTKRRKLQSVGFRNARHYYDSPELHQYKNQGISMNIHIDPYNPTAVWAKTPDGALIECPTRDWDAIDNPFYGELTPDNDAPDDAMKKATDRRAELARISTNLAGTPLHQLPYEKTGIDSFINYSNTAPDHDIDVDDAMPEFTTEGN